MGSLSSAAVFSCYSDTKFVETATSGCATSCLCFTCRNYIACDMGSLFAAAGFNCDTKYMSSSTKTWCFTKPAAEPEQAVKVAATVEAPSSSAAPANSAGADLN